MARAFDEGRYYGGGMEVAPAQNRNDDTLSLVVMHRSCKLKTLMVFPSIFKGEHVKHSEMVDVTVGKNFRTLRPSVRASDRRRNGTRRNRILRPHRLRRFLRCGRQTATA
ncbi:MAG: hypothetical protein ACLUSP_04130 [Christensenellales bacterium]